MLAFILGVAGIGVMDGYTLLKTLLERGDLTPAIVLTGLGSIREAMWPWWPSRRRA